MTQANRKSLNSTAYCFPGSLPKYAVRRISDGQFLDENGGFRPMGGETNGEKYTGARNDSRIDYRTCAHHWDKLGLIDCEVVAISEVVLITATPIEW